MDRMRLTFVLSILVMIFAYGAAQWNHNFMEDLDHHVRYGSSRKYGKKIQSDDPYEERWFIQHLDHFNPADDQIWKQRYFVNDKYYETNGPVFLFIGGEGAISDQWVYEGQMFEDARHFGAMMFILEHRFYGKSQPTGNLSTENLAYLNTQQALLDTAYFIEGMNEAHRLPNGTKWITYGCSYAGSLSAWMRAKYPHLVHGAVSSSAPLLAKADFSEFMVVVYDKLKSHNQVCLDTVSNATRQLDEMAKTAIGRKKLKKLFKLCNPIDKRTSIKDFAYIYRNIISPLAIAVQYDMKYGEKSKSLLDTYCDILVDEKKGDPVDRLADLNDFVRKIPSSKKASCRRFKYDDLVDHHSYLEPKPHGVGERQWIYQSCTEFGFFATTTAKPTFFGDRFSLDFYLQLCADVFGQQFEKLTYSGVERTNLIFGGLDLENLVSNVVFVHGSTDPWHKLGITKSNNPKAPAIFIKGTSHCASMYPALGDDVLQLVKARKQIKQLIGQWLED